MKKEISSIHRRDIKLLSIEDIQREIGFIRRDYPNFPEGTCQEIYSRVYDLVMREESLKRNGYKTYNDYRSMYVREKTLAEIIDEMEVEDEDEGRGGNSSFSDAGDDGDSGGFLSDRVASLSDRLKKALSK